MKKLILICTLFSAMMSWPVVGHAQETKKVDSKEVCRHENYGSNRQSRIVEKACMSKNTSSLERNVANAVSRGNNDKGKSSDSKSSSSSGSNSASSSQSQSSNSSSSNNSKCTTCSGRAKALQNRKSN